jgi:quercetin dioxygenase-like cupin family protein
MVSLLLFVRVFPRVARKNAHAKKESTALPKADGSDCLSLNAIDNDTPEDRMITDTTRVIYNPVQRDRVTFLKTAAETGGELTLLEMEVAPGGGNSLHIHATYAERFTVIEGELGVQIGKQRRTLHSGETDVVPAGVMHRWYNLSQRPARIYVELRPGHAGFEQALRIVYGLAADGHTNAAGIPKNLLHLAVLAQISDIKMVGPTAALNPILGLLARIARRRGVEQRLLARYGAAGMDSGRL